MSTQTESPARHPAVTRYVAPARDVSGDLVSRADRLICGDALEVMKRLPDNSVDLVHTSPPYNIAKPYAHSTSDQSSPLDYVRFLTSAIAELKRVLRPGGSLFWQTGYTQPNGTAAGIEPIDFLSHDLFRAAPTPLTLWDRIIWRYWGGHAFTKKFTNKHETILWFVKPGREPYFDVDQVRERSKSYDKRNNFWGRNPGNVWEVDRVAFGSTGQTSHIAVFPEEISERIVRSCSRPGNLVLDPFAGSGTVPAVARGLNRRWLGIEISPQYIDEAAIRVGRRQPTEFESLAAALMIELAFQVTSDKRRIFDIVAALCAWMETLNIESLQSEFEADVGKTLGTRNGRNGAKQQVWKKYDERLGITAAEIDHPISFVDRLLCARYKLRRHLNGVSRYRSALETLVALRDALTHDTRIDFLARIAEQEPSSFRVDGDMIALHATTARATTDDQQLRATVDDGADAPTTEQRRML